MENNKALNETAGERAALKYKRKVMILEERQSEWGHFLESFFEDVSAEIIWYENAENAGFLFDRLKPEICFVNPEFLSRNLVQKIKVRLETDPIFYLYRIGEEKNPAHSLSYKEAFGDAQRSVEFLPLFVKPLRLPERVRILTADDEPEIRAVVAEYLERSKTPVFEIIPAENGAEAISKLEGESPDIALLDFRMPEKNGHEVYAHMKTLERQIPAIIYLDIFSSEQIVDLYQIGRPVIVEKGGQYSSMKHLSALIRKVVYFEGRW